MKRSKVGVVLDFRLGQVGWWVYEFHHFIFVIRVHQHVGSKWWQDNDFHGRQHT